MEDGASHESEMSESITDREWADNVLDLLRRTDWQNLAPYVHPEKGLFFSPDLHIDTVNDRQFTKDEVRKFSNHKQKLNWGNEAGSGETIELSINAYQKRYINDHDYSNADTIGVNKRVSKGNMKWNLHDIWPEAKFVEYHLKGFAEQYNGMDWASLILVWDRHKEKRKLIAVLHGHWTP